MTLRGGREALGDGYESRKEAGGWGVGGGGYWVVSVKSFISSTKRSIDTCILEFTNLLAFFTFYNPFDDLTLDHLYISSSSEYWLVYFKQFKIIIIRTTRNKGRTSGQIEKLGSTT